MIFSNIHHIPTHSTLFCFTIL